MARLERILASVVLGGAFLINTPARAEEPTQPPAQQAEETIEIPLFPWQKIHPQNYGPPPATPPQPEKVSRENYIARAKSMIMDPDDFCPQIYEEYGEHGYGGYYSHRDENQIDCIIDHGFAMLARIGKNPAEPEVLDSLFQHVRNSYDSSKRAAYIALDRMPKETVLKHALGRAEMYEFRFVADMYARYDQPLPRDEILRLSKEALDFGKPGEAHEGFFLCYGRDIPAYVNIHIARAYLESNYSIDSALSRYAEVVNGGSQIPAKDIVTIYERVVHSRDIRGATEEISRQHVPLPSEEIRGVINARIIAMRAYQQRISLETMLDNSFGEAPLDIGTFLQLAEGLGQPIDMKKLRKDSLSKAYSLCDLQEIARRTTPLTTAELERYAKTQIMAYRDPKCFHEGVLAIEEIRKQDKHYMLNQNLITFLEKAIDDVSLSSDDVAKGLHLRYGVDVGFPHHQFRARVERQMEMEDLDWLDALRAARHAGDAEYYNRTLLGVADRMAFAGDVIPDQKILARYAQQLLSSSIGGDDADAAIRLGELLYDRGFNEQARDCYKYVFGATDAAHPYHGAAEKRIQMCEDKMRKMGIPTDYGNAWPKNEPKK